jgi:hypothetical protein
MLRSQNVVMLTEMARLRDSDGGVNDAMWRLKHLLQYQRLADSILNNRESLVDPRVDLDVDEPGVAALCVGQVDVAETPPLRSAPQNSAPARSP